jgi:sugar lactone lactonase YvrE
VTRYANGLTKRASNLGPVGLQRPFGVAVGRRGNVFVTGNGNDAVATLASDGSVLEVVEGGGLKRPLGVATDSRGYAWVADSGEIVPPCEQDAVAFEQAPGGDALTLIGPEGDRLATYTGAGLSTPWGVAVDGADTVWVANYGGGRLSHLCGTAIRRCPAGRRSRGASISPLGGGYRFDGLTRNTAIAIDPSGNVWLANTAETEALATNPGGRQIVAFLGLATPIRTPLIGPPERP